MKQQGNLLNFWLLQLFGWLPFFALMMPLYGDEYFLSINSVVFACSITIIAIIGSLILRSTFHFLSPKIKSSGVWLLTIFVSSLCVAILTCAVHQTLWLFISKASGQYSEIYQSQPFSVLTGLLWFVYLFWSSLYLFITNKQNLSRAVIHQQRLELLLKENKIERLLEQLNPHFMFNTINNIRSLILIDKDRARDMLSSFADIMRYQINNDDALVSLKDELDFVLEYIELHRLQLGHRLNFSHQVEPSLLTNMIPRMALQLLVENAIKHGFGQSAKPGSLKISIAHAGVSDKPDQWFISVQNSGSLNTQKTNSGIGLANLKERLTMTIDNPCYFTLTETNNMVEARLLFNS